MSHEEIILDKLFTSRNLISEDKVIISSFFQRLQVDMDETTMFITGKNIYDNRILCHVLWENADGTVNYSMALLPDESDYKDYINNKIGYLDLVQKQNYIVINKISAGKEAKLCKIKYKDLPEMFIGSNTYFKDLESYNA